MFDGNFLPKEARFGGAFKAVENIGRTKGPGVYKQPVGNAHRFFDEKELADLERQKIKEDGNGMFGDLAIGATRFLPKGKEIYNKTIDKTVDFKRKAQELDQVGSEKVKKALKVKEGSMLDRFTSSKNRRTVGETTLSDGTKGALEEQTRRSSFLSPVKNTTAVATPFLASAYVADKLYPEEKEAAYQDLQYEKTGVENELFVERLDKKAALEKVAFLENRIEKLASQVEELEEEKNLFWKEAEMVRKEKREVEREKLAYEKELMDKTASYDEFKMRAHARERSKHAIKIAEDMLETGFIKQAEFDKKVDFLMDCDEETFNLHSTLNKKASDNQKGLETSAYFVHYSSKEDESRQSRPSRGLSARGQTIGEAAKDLTK